jgi:hypothetical protein
MFTFYSNAVTTLSTNGRGISTHLFMNTLYTLLIRYEPDMVQKWKWLIMGIHGSWWISLSALALGFSGWLVYLFFWFSIRVSGALTLEFGTWGPPWLKWFELWIEPFILLGWLAFFGWAIWREAKAYGRRVERAGSRNPDESSGRPPASKGFIRALREMDATNNYSDAD